MPESARARIDTKYVTQSPSRLRLLASGSEAYLVVQTARFFYIYIYLYPALMYAVMFYVILNKRKLHFPLAKNVMHSPSLELRRTLRHTSTPDIYRKIVPVVRLG